MQSAAVEKTQVGYFTVADQIAAAHAKVESARAALDVLVEQVAADVAQHEIAQRDLVGVLVDEHDQSVEDVAILLDLSVTQVRAARTGYRAARKQATPVAVAAAPADQDTNSGVTDDEAVA